VTTGSSRRNVLKAGASGLALALLSPELARALPAAPPADLAARLARLVAAPDKGPSLAAAFGPVRSPGAVLDDLRVSWAVSAADLEAASDPELLATVIRHHARDLEDGNFVTRNGWVLSRTEAGLYELAAAASLTS
jgi:hypothetical protein